MLHNSQRRTCIIASAAVLTILLCCSTVKAGLADGWVPNNPPAIPPTYNGVTVQGECVVFVENYANAYMHCQMVGIDQYHPYYKPYPTDPSHNYNSDGAHWIWDDTSPVDGHDRLQPANTDRYRNDGSSFPQPQDIVVWSSNIGGGYGHIAIVDVANSRSDIWVVDANWSNNDDEIGRRHQISIDVNILGWFRKKGAGGGVADPANIYVSLSGSDASNGSSGTPFRTIQHAIDMASAGGATINIAPGSYNEKNNCSGKHIHFVSTGGTVQTGG